MTNQRELRILQAIAGALALLKLAFVLAVPAYGDEAYYWLWGQHLALSYFDHPGLHAWVQALMAAVFGWSLFGLRAAALAGTLVIVFLIFVWAKRLGGSDWQIKAWAGTVVFFASPMLFVFTTISSNDYLLVTLGLLSTHFFADDFARRFSGQRNRFGSLFLGALFLGLAGLAKYNAVFLGLGVVFAIVGRQELRHLLRCWQLYAAAVLSVALQAPTLVWNISRDFTSFQFHLSDRFGGQGLSFRGAETFVPFVLEALLLVSPFLAVMLGLTLFRRATDSFERGLLGVGKPQLLLNVFVFGGLSLFSFVHYYWGILGYALMAALAGLAQPRRWLFWGHAVYGIAAIAMISFNFGILPIQAMTGNGPGRLASQYGWEQVGASVARARAAEAADFIGAVGYFEASLLGFALQDPDVMDFSDRPGMFKIWFDEGAHSGKSALFVSDQIADIDPILGRFDTVTKVDTIPVSRFGYLLQTFVVYRGTGYRPEGAQR